MPPRIPENFSTWLIDWSPATIMGHTMPPRDPNDDDNDNGDDEDDTAEPEDDLRAGGRERIRRVAPHTIRACSSWTARAVCSVPRALWPTTRWCS